MTDKGVFLPTILVLALLGATGCGKDPILAAAEKHHAEAEEGGATGQPGAPTPGAQVVPGGTPGTPVPGGEPGATGAPQPGIPEQPAPGNPNEPAPAQAGAPSPGQPGGTQAGIAEPPKPGIPIPPKPGAPGTPPPYDGPTVVVSGTVAYPDYTSGSVRITAFDGDHTVHSATPPKVVGSSEMKTPGTFEMKVPLNLGRTFLEAVIDENGDGHPGPQDPQGQADRYPVTVKEADIDGLTITLTKRAPPPDGGKGDF